MLTTKTKAPTAVTAGLELCLDLWDEGLSSVLAGPRGEGADRGERGGDGNLPAACEMASMRGHEVLLRLALLADFYRYQAEDLLLDEVRSARKLFAIRREAFRLLCSCALIQQGQGVRPRRAASDPSTTPPRTDDAVEPGAGDLRERARPRSPEPPAAREDSVKWSRFCFATRNKSYYAKLVRAFQTVKAVGHTMLTLNSEWALGCYYRLAAAYTCERPLEMAAACLPQLREAAAIVSLEQFHKLGSLMFRSVRALSSDVFEDIMRRHYGSDAIPKETPRTRLTEGYKILSAYLRITHRLGKREEAVTEIREAHREMMRRGKTGFDEIEGEAESRDSSQADNAEIEAAEALMELGCAGRYVDTVECNTTRSC
ncbi:hypothetical protein Q5P01_021956 [Channa striata]|uniref:Uncharacterized protein n=1 Tax=Channa striata TaxID=64152 RepID=A0AA88LQW3_CHASR|nr:hypothetical protein Q5P01_021956 [Channa striata]